MIPAYATSVHETAREDDRSIAIVIFSNRTVAVVEAGGVHGHFERHIAFDAAVAPQKLPLDIKYT
jgi:hypothetical protein